MTTNAQLATQVADALTRWNDQLDQLADWLSGDPVGGPNFDGKYPLTNAERETELFLCLPAILDLVDGPAGQAEISKVASEAAATLSGSHKDAAEAAKVIAEAARDAAQTAKQQAQVLRDEVAADWAAVSYTAGLVSTDAATVAVKRDEVLAAADTVATDAATAVQARVGAEVARDEAQGYAASINPAQFATPADIDARINTIIDAAPATMDTLNELAAALGDDPNFATTVTNDLAGKAPIIHGHAVADVTGLQTALDGKSALGHGHVIADVSGLQTALNGKSDWNHAHNYSDLANIPATFAPSAHTHAWADITGIPATFAPSAHTHTIGDVTGLQGALDSKATRYANEQFRDIFATRGNNTGAIYFGDGLRYLYCDGTDYHLPSGTLHLNNRNVLTDIDGKAPLNGVGTGGVWPIGITGAAARSTVLSSNQGSHESSLQYWQANGDTNLNPNADYWYGIRMGHGDAQTYYSSSLVVNFFSDDLRFRRKVNGVDQPWATVWHDKNFNPASKADAGHTHSYLPLSGGTLTGNLVVGGTSYIGNTTTSLRKGSDGQLIFNVSTADNTFLQVGTSYYKLWNAGNFNPANYLPLGGGTLTGNLTVPNIYAPAANVRLDVTSDYGIRFLNRSGTPEGYLHQEAGSFGMLASDGNWAVRCAASGVNFDKPTQFNGSTFLLGETYSLGFVGQGSGGNSGVVGSNYKWGYQQAGTWASPNDKGEAYPDLILGYHTGVKIGGYFAYGGTRFYNDHPEGTAPTEIFSVGKGDSHVRVQNDLIIQGTGSVALKGSYNVLRVNNGNGYVDIGPADATFCHFQTDRGAYYFDKPVQVNGTLTHYGVGPYLHHATTGMGSGKITTSTAAPSGGADGDIWLQI